MTPHPPQQNFHGLLPYPLGSVAYFFGRERESEALHVKLTRFHMAAVVGPARCGKTSLIQRGLWSILQKAPDETWQWVQFDVGRCLARQTTILDGFLEAFARQTGIALSEFLAEAGQPLQQVQVLVVVDHLEAAFVGSHPPGPTLFPDDLEEFGRFLTALAQLQNGFVIIALRSEVLPAVLALPPLAEMITRHSFLLAEPAPGDEDQRTIITKPLSMWGMPPVVAENILKDAIQLGHRITPHTLPLISYCVQQLARLAQAEGISHLRYAHYEALGGLSGLIEQAAETSVSYPDGVWSEVFDRLLTVDADYGLYAHWLNLEAIDWSAQVQTLLAHLEQVGLLWVEQPWAKLPVDAVWQTWPRLAEWVNAHQLAWHRITQIRHEARRWANAGKPDEQRPPAETIRAFQAACQLVHYQVDESVISDYVQPEEFLILRALYQERQQLVPFIEVSQRASLGRRLAQLGDPRLGIGLGESDLPRIVWKPISPGGKLEIAGQIFDVPPFYMAQYLITHSQFQAFMVHSEGFANPHWWRGFPAEGVQQAMDHQRQKASNYPRDSVSWYQAMAFARWLDAMLPQEERPEALTPNYKGVRATASPWQIRLPTEWEWQWAAQGGVLKRPYPWGGWLPNRANTTETEIAQTTAVGMFPAGTSAFGVDDLAGNLWEWCLNDYQSLEINLKQASWKSTRGGAMSCDQYAAACTYRAYNQPRFQWFDHGIRLVYGPPLDVE